MRRSTIFEHISMDTISCSAIVLLKHFKILRKSTSINVGWQGHKLAEHLSREEGCQLIVWFSPGAYGEVSYHKCSLFEGDGLLQEVGGSEGRFIL